MFDTGSLPRPVLASLRAHRTVLRSDPRRVFCMAGRSVGLVIVGESVTVVDAELPDDPGEPLTIVADHTWKLQAGQRAPAYAVLHQRCTDYLRENGVGSVVVKASALP